ncbi:hypothetical protein HY030_00010 [Candidatus Gottesmanbacteria bacterium]|nr:hypothetical protein [Candidatus Gottesmanbacteria bacterium]
MLPNILEKINRIKENLPRKKLYLAELVGLFLVVVIFYWLANSSGVFFPIRNKTPLKKTALTPTPTLAFKYAHYPIPAPLPQGKQTYIVSRGAGSTGPNFQQISIEPFDPKKGETQKIDVKVGSNATMKAVKVTLNTDYEVKTYDAKLKEGTKINGVWEAVVVINDSHDYVYRVRVEAEDSVEPSSVTLTIR